MNPVWLDCGLSNSAARTGSEVGSEVGEVGSEYKLCVAQRWRWRCSEALAVALLSQLSTSLEIKVSGRGHLVVCSAPRLPRAALLANCRVGFRTPAATTGGGMCHNGTPRTSLSGLHLSSSACHPASPTQLARARRAPDAHLATTLGRRFSKPQKLYWFLTATTAPHDRMEPLRMAFPAVIHWRCSAAIHASPPSCPPCLHPPHACIHPDWRRWIAGGIWTRHNPPSGRGSPDATNRGPWSISASTARRGEPPCSAQDPPRDLPVRWSSGMAHATWLIQDPRRTLLYAAGV